MQARGDTDEALAAYGKSLEISEQLAGLDPANTGWQHDLAMSHLRIGGLLEARGDAEGALAAYGKSLEISERLVRPRPGRTPAGSTTLRGAMRGSAICWRRVAIPMARWRLMAKIWRSWSGLPAWTRRTPAGSVTSRVSHGKIGDLLAARGDTDEALAAYGKDLEISERLAGLDPANTGWQHDLAVSHRKTGDLLAARGDAEEALAAYDKALEIIERLVSLDPANTGWQRNLAVSHRKIGNLLAARSDTDEGAGRLWQGAGDHGTAYRSRPCEHRLAARPCGEP